MVKRMITSGICLLFFILLSAQCPERQWLWKRLIFIRDSSDLLPQPPLKELTAYLAEMKNCPYQNDSTHALLLQRIGAQYFKQGDYNQAINYTRQSVNMITAHAKSPAINFSHIIRSYHNLSVFYDSLNNTEERNKLRDSSLTIAIRLKVVDLYLLWALQKEMDRSSQTGDYERALRYANSGELLTKQYLDGKDSLKYEYALPFLIGKVNILRSYKKYDEAENLLLATIDACKTVSAKKKLGPVFLSLADVQVEKGDFKQAQYNYSKSLLYNQRTGYKDGCIQTLNDLAYFLYYKAYKDYHKALITYNQALAYLQDGQSPFEKINIFTNIAMVYVSSERYDSAFRYFQLAFNQIGPGYNETLLLSNLDSIIDVTHAVPNNVEYLIGLIRDKGYAFLHAYKKTRDGKLLSEAIQFYKTADLVLDKIKLKHSEIKSKLFWRSYSRSLYEHAIEASYYAHNTNDAFYFFEKSRAVLLHDELKEQGLFNSKNVEEQIRLRRLIIQQERELSNRSAVSAGYSELQNQLIVNKQKLEHLIKTIKANHPLYYQSFLDTSFITTRQVHDEILRDHQALVELFTGDSAVYSLVLTKEKSYLNRIDKSDFDSSANKYFTYISNPELLNRNYEAFISVARHLYGLIFKDILLPEGRIIISPGDRYFPFESLISSPAGRENCWFLNSHAISYTYSARYLLNRFNKSLDNRHDFIAFAPTKYPSSFKLVALTGSNASLNRIKPYFKKAEILKDKAASKDNFLRHSFKYKVIQLYTHASDSGATGEPVIYFSDSALYLSDLIPEDKPVTELIVLSACKTANGDLYPGEGVFSFNRQFAAVGIPASIANLWEVENESTYQITELFYMFLSKGLPTDIALQKAKLEFIHRNAGDKDLPFYWAAPVLVGKTGIIEHKESIAWVSVLLFPTLAALLSFLLWMKVRKHNNRVPA